MISLEQMTNLANALLDAEDKVASAEKELKAAKEQARLLREETIPSAMQELGLDSFKLTTGETFTVKQEVYASIPSDYKEEAMRWLERNGFGGLIKVDVTAAFGRNQKDISTSLLEELHRRGFATKVSEGVAPQTLKAFLREQLAKGTDIPLDLFGARPTWITKIKG